MSDLNSLQIRIPESFSSGLHRDYTTSIGNSPVLESLLPELCRESSPSLIPAQVLRNIDGYMLEETEQLLQRIVQLCSALNLPEQARFRIKFCGSTLSVSSDDVSVMPLSGLLNLDKWLVDTCSWLTPNYTALASSQELLEFSHLYAKNKQTAVRYYRHLQQDDSEMKCYIDGKVQAGSTELSFRVASPVSLYHLK